jgi:nucleotide-binding universal stress UspA family protein
MKMLLATDGSESSIGAAQFLSRLRCSPDDEITVLYVIPEAPLSDADESHYADLMRIKKEIAPKILDATIDELKDLKAKISTVVATGHPDKAIIDAAVLMRMDMIVMGARGINPFRSVTRRRLSFGSILVTRKQQWKASGPLMVCTPQTVLGRFETGRLLARIPARGSEVTILCIRSSFADIGAISHEVAIG